MVGWLSDNWWAQGGDSADVLGMAMASVTGSVALVALCSLHTFLAAVHALPEPGVQRGSERRSSRRQARAEHGAALRLIGSFRSSYYAILREGQLLITDAIFTSWRANYRPPRSRSNLFKLRGGLETAFHKL